MFVLVFFKCLFKIYFAPCLQCKRNCKLAVYYINNALKLAYLMRMSSDYGTVDPMANVTHHQVC